jgi:LysR family hydrogen peroxide-inducible transcriptional activator
MICFDGFDNLFQSMRLSVRQLECLVGVADALHFGRAARQLAITQPALSAQVRQAEELLGVQLFERGRRRVLETPAGTRVVAQARAALREIDACAELAGAARRPLVGPLRLGVIPTVAPFLLPARLPAVRRAYPELQLVLREEKTDVLVRGLQQGQLELLLLALPVEAELETLALYAEPFVFVASRGHPLARGRGPLRESQLADSDVMLLEDGHCLRDQALAVCGRAGAREASGLRATSLGTLVQMVANGLGTTLLPERSLPVLLRPDLGMVARRFRAPAPSRRIGLAWRPGSPRRDEFQRLGALLAPPRRRPRAARRAR